jgi:DNA replication protein DnaC
VPLSHPDFGKPVRCSCREAEDRARHAERAQAASNLTGLLLSKTFATFDCSRSPSARVACNVLRDFAEQPQGWALVQGNRGTGKTHLLAAVANHLLSRGEGRQMPLYVVAPDFLDYLRAGYDSDKISQNAAQRMEDARGCPVLLLDDLGAEKRSEWTDEQLYRLLNFRYNEGLPTVVASNVTLDKLEPRIASRLQDASLSRIVLLAGADQRIASGAQGAQ